MSTFGAIFETSHEKQEQLIELRRARASGIRRVSFQIGEARREVEFKTDAEMRDAIIDLERRIANEEAEGRPRIVRIAPSRGY
jgi:hypothetical protein